jgi:ABC-type sugar transport system ATPase subunit
MDEPTRGVDVGARNEIYRFIRQLAGTGTGIILISSDILEVLGMTDKIIVLKDGLVVDQISGDQANEENVISKATGIKNNKEILEEVRK